MPVRGWCEDACRIVGASLVFAIGAVRAQTPATVTVSNQYAGQTPLRIGYNSGHFFPGSNTAAWWAYSGVNAARVWSSATNIERLAEDDLPPWGDGVTSLASFDARRLALRADPLSFIYVNWGYFADRYANERITGNNMYLGYAFQTLTNLGMTLNVALHRSETSYPWGDAATAAGWADRWEHWQHFYAQTFHMARYYGIERFQMFNEPDHSSHPTLTQTRYLEELQFASDAIQSAVEDVNRLFGKSLTAQVQAPVTAGGENKFHPVPGGDVRDDSLGWGELAVRNRHRDYTGAWVPAFNLLRTYAYQRYDLTGPAFGSDLAAIKDSIAVESGGEDIGVATTEFNVHSAANFATMAETLDSPSKLARMGSILSNLANNRPDELYVFKFSQTSNGTDGSVKKNGTHYVSNTIEPYNVGGVTKGGQVVRLFARAFAGGKRLLSPPIAGGAGAGNLHLAACREADRSRYYILSTNVSDVNDVDLSVNLAAWAVPAGVVATVEEVSSRFHGEVSGLLVVPASGVITFRQRATSVLLITVPRALAAETTLTAVDDAMIKAGGNANSNYGQSANLWVKANQTNPSARNVSLIKFDLGAIARADVRQAVLKVTGHNPGGATVVIAHVYGITDGAWEEESVTWNTAPNLGTAMGHDGSGTIDEIADNFVEGAGQSASVIGHLSADGTQTELMLDITPFVQRGSGTYVSLLVTREVRWDGDVDDVNFLRMASTEDGTALPPRLTIWRENLVSADFDADGDVDLADFAAFQTCFNGPNRPPGAGCTADFDSDNDGDVDLNDFTAFQTCFNGPNQAPACAG